jgi:pyrroline-5-carboxylate reductase
MATALIGGLVGRGAAGADGAPRVTVIDPAEAQRERLAREFGVTTLAAPDPAGPACDVLVLAVKPQQMREALLPMARPARDALVVSVAAGIRAADIARWPGASCARCPTRRPSSARASPACGRPLRSAGPTARRPSASCARSARRSGSARKSCSMP